MGWSSGSRVFDNIIDILYDNIEDVRLRKKLYTELIQVFEDADCDTLYECKGRDDCFDLAFEELYPDEDED